MVTDVFDKTKRSEIMSRIRGRRNRDTEQALVGVFKAEGITGWRRNQRVFGKPDFVFRRERVCVFVDGCFGHGCPLHGTWPKQNGRFCREKIEGNRQRENQVTPALRRAGWRVLRIWEHKLKPSNRRRLIARIRRVLYGGRSS